MGMTFEESLNNLKELQEDYQRFHDDVWQDPEAYGIMAESLKVAIDTMRKYQKIQKVLERIWNIPGHLINKEECLDRIMEAYREVR